MKTNAIVRIILFSLAILVLLGILAVGLGVGMYMFTGNVFSDSVYHIEMDDQISGGTVASVGSVDASQIRQLEIEWVSGSITIEPSENTDQITFSETEQTEDKYKMVWKQSGDKLSIQFCETKVFFGISIDRSKDLVITVPQDWICNELSFEVASADVEIRDLSIREVEFDGASGVCSFENCSVDKLDVDTASGDIEFRGTLQQLDCDAASANCVVEVTNVPRQININTASGDLDLTLPESCGFTVSMDAMSSDFTSDFPTTTVNGNHVYGDGSCRINIEAMSGDVTIRKGE